MPGQMLDVLKLTYAGVPWTTPGRHKAEWEHSPSSQPGWLCLQDHHYITRPLTQRHQADIEDEPITSQGNIQPEVTEGLLQIRREAEKSGGDMAEWHWDLFWQCGGTRSSPAISLETQGTRQMIKQLPICVADASVSENALWFECRPEGVLQICEQHKTFHCNSLVILAIGEQKMAGCLGHCSEAVPQKCVLLLKD